MISQGRLITLPVCFQIFQHVYGGLFFDRNSTDTHETERLIVKLDTCQVNGYEVYTIEQDADPGEPIALEAGDFFVVWDEDSGHGSMVDFNFPDASSNYGYTDVTDDDTDYVRVSSTDDSIINWRVYMVTASGVLTINNTGANEHDVFRMCTSTVCCWFTDVIYVDESASGSNDGNSWTNAFVELKDAIERIRTSGCNTKYIWVAGGTYSPGDDYTHTFDIPDGVEVYGGMKGDENPENPLDDPSIRTVIPCKSVLTGYIDPSNKVDDVVTMGENTKLHGFVIENGLNANIYGSGDSFTIEHSVVAGAVQRGIECSSGNLSVNWCTVSGNGDDGIYHNVGSLAVNNCKIFGNGENGINGSGTIENCEIHNNGMKGIDGSGTIQNCDIYNNGMSGIAGSGTILNCVIHHNGFDSGGYSGSGIIGSSVVRNCTIANNREKGISGGTGYATATNCIIWGNNGSGQDTSRCSVTFSCVEDGDSGGTGNTNADPEFAYTNHRLGNYHLSAESPLIDKYVDSSVPAGELDIDGDDRVYNVKVDYGADEVWCIDEIANNLTDVNADGLVNNLEFAMFNYAWFEVDPNEFSEDPSESERQIWMKARRCNFDKTGDSTHQVDFADLKVFANNWLWQACWKKLPDPPAQAAQSSSQSMSMPVSMTVSVPEPTVAEQLLQAEGNLDFLNDIWDNTPGIQNQVDEDNWDNMIDSLENWIDELEGGL